MSCLNMIANQSVYEKDTELIQEGKRVLSQFEDFYTIHRHAERIMDRLIEEASKGEFSMFLSRSCFSGDCRLNILDIFNLEDCPITTAYKIEHDQVRLLPKNIVGYHTTTFNCDTETYEVKRYFKYPGVSDCSCLNVEEVARGYCFSYEVFLAYKIKELILKDEGSFFVSPEQGVLISWGKRNHNLKFKENQENTKCFEQKNEKFGKFNDKIKKVLNIEIEKNIRYNNSNDFCYFVISIR